MHIVYLKYMHIWINILVVSYYPKLLFKYACIFKLNILTQKADI